MNINRNLFLNIILILSSILLVFLLLEIILRFTHYNIIISKNEEFRHYYIADNNKGYDIRPNVKQFQSNVDEEVYFPVWSNTLGCFDEPYKGEKDYILLLGDSFAHGHAPFADKWGSQVEKLLGYRVLKCGVDSYGTKQEYLKAKEIIETIKTPPRLIILGYCLNDLGDDYLFPNLTVIDGYVVHQKQLSNVKTGETVSRINLEEKYGLLSSGFFIKIKNFIKRNSIIGRLFISTLRNNIIDQSYNQDIFISFLDYPWIENIWKDHLNNINLINSLAINNDAKLLIVIIPTREQVYPYLFDWDNSKLDPERPNKKLTSFLKKEGIGYIDLLPLLKGYANQKPRKHLSPGEDLYWRYDGHWSIRGEHLVGLLVARYILENHVIPVTDRDEKIKLIIQKLAEFQIISSSQ
ncbi:MAG: SGNH/GDSL hydrolase family protein [Thermodesulfobacteriota bacterium]